MNNEPELGEWTSDWQAGGESDSSADAIRLYAQGRRGFMLAWALSELTAGALALPLVAYLGWVATITAYALWTGLLKRHPANRVAPFSLGVPVVGLAAGMLALGEVITPWQWTGIALVVAALMTVMLGGRWLKAGVRA